MDIHMPQTVKKNSLDDLSVGQRKKNRSKFMKRVIHQNKISLLYILIFEFNKIQRNKAYEFKNNYH